MVAAAEVVTGWWYTIKDRKPPERIQLKIKEKPLAPSETELDS
jgi:hypothetical protein